MSTLLGSSASLISYHVCAAAGGYTIESIWLVDLGVYVLESFQKSRPFGGIALLQLELLRMVLEIEQGSALRSDFAFRPFSCTHFMA
ncbi:hypothetical protein HYQ46_002757 [Verticillium longisporum]|nr:hypothetical protein HYQ46_002757 [Verticillium longisporum]